jgi:membrane protein YqaA with SNARE-associated domain
MLFILGIQTFLKQMGEALTAMGVFGLLLINLLDSAFVPIPGGPDAAMITLSVLSPRFMPVYALVSALGSTAGCTLLYLAARRAGLRVLKRIKAERRERIENLLGRYDMLAVMVPALLPPPFPFKPFVLCAGAFKLRLWRFIVAIFIGRAIRFFAEGWLAVTFGEKSAGDFIKQHGLKMLIGIAAILAIIFAVRYFRSRRAVEGVNDEIQSES